MFTVGTGKVDITPPLNMPYLFKVPERHARFRDVHDRLLARSLYVSDGRDDVLIIATDMIGLSADVLGRGGDFVADIKGRLQEATGIDADRIMLTNTHAHSTADTIDIRPIIESEPEAKHWLEQLAGQIVRSAVEAGQNTFEARVRTARGRVPGIIKNRRGEPCTDDELAVLVFESPAGEKALLVNFACHPVIVQAQPSISADYPGVVQRTIETAVPGVRACLFLQGACGDINPAIGWTRSFEDVESFGAAVADKAIALCNGLDANETPFHPARIRIESKRIAFASRPVPTEADLALSMAELGELEAKAMQATDREDAARQVYLAQSAIEEMRARMLQGGGPFDGELQLVRIGDALIFGIPGEPFCRLGKELKACVRPPLTPFVAGYANGYLGYIAPPDAWDNGGYEVSPGPWSKVDANAFSIILETFKDMCADVAADPDKSDTGR